MPVPLLVMLDTQFPLCEVIVQGEELQTLPTVNRSMRSDPVVLLDTLPV
jgi:hypothetical protein